MATPESKWTLVSKHEFDGFQFFAAHRMSWFGGPVVTLLAGGIVFAGVAYSPPGEWIYPVLVGGPFLLLGLGLLVRLVLNWVRRVRKARVYDNGIRFRQGRTDYEYTWDQVREVHRFDYDIRHNNERSSEFTRGSDFWMVFDDGRSANFGHSLSDQSKLADFAQRVVTDRLYPAAWAGLADGGVSFGRLRLSGDGLRVGRAEQPWTAVKRARVDNGQLVIDYKSGKPTEVLLREIPNYAVLIRLLQKLGKFRE